MMNTLTIPHTPYEASCLAFGCMELVPWSSVQPGPAETHRALDAVSVALESGFNFFDHANIYSGGGCETVFREVWKSGLARREDLIIQSKCGIRFAGDPPGCPVKRFDFSREHILSAVDASLQRLGIDYLDILLLHRPDPLMDGEEVADAFTHLLAAGKARFFGVSNFTPWQIDCLQDFLDFPLVVNQVRLSLLHLPLIDGGQVYGGPERGCATRGEGALERCMAGDILVQAYGPLHRGYLGGKPVEEGNPEKERIERTARAVAEVATETGLSREAVALAWLRRHPAGVQPVIGTKNPDRIRACTEAAGFQMSREHWYRLYLAARGQELP